MLGNPVMLVDPDGRSAEKNDWVPDVDKDGNVTYTSEDGDNYNTFVDQYGESAADEVFNSNCDGCFDKSATFSDGEVNLNSDKLHKLVIGTEKTTDGGLFSGFADMLGGGSGVRTTASIQDVYNQIKAGSKLNSIKNGDSAIKMSELFMSDNGTRIGLLDMRGPLKVDGTTYPLGYIDYTSMLNAQDNFLSLEPDNLSHGSKESWRFHSKTVLLITYRTQK